jgi:hypothetical protein
MVSLSGEVMQEREADQAKHPAQRLGPEQRAGFNTGIMPEEE